MVISHRTLFNCRSRVSRAAIETKCSISFILSIFGISNSQLQDCMIKHFLLESPITIYISIVTLPPLFSRITQPELCDTLSKVVLLMET